MFMQCLYWGIVTNEDNKFTWGCLQIFLRQNYPIFLCSAGYLLGVEDLWIVGAVWLVTFILGTVNYFGWLIWLLNRWPPMAGGSGT